jgi:hypothetical protein
VKLKPTDSHIVLQCAIPIISLCQHRSSRWKCSKISLGLTLYGNFLREVGHRRVHRLRDPVDKATSRVARYLGTPQHLLPGLRDHLANRNLLFQKSMDRPQGAHMVWHFNDEFTSPKLVSRTLIRANREL